MNYDLVIYNADIVDGTGDRSIAGDVAVNDGRISKIGQLGSHSAKHEIDAQGLILSPGFVDSHSHADLTLIAGSAEHEKVRMGVTTEIIGQCGFSAFPLNPIYADLRRQSMAGFLPGAQLAWDWPNLTEYKAAAQKRGMTHHVAPLVGHGSVRQAVMGDNAATPTPIQLDKMCRLVDEALQQGAHGLSSGLIYSPGCFASTEELIVLSRVVADHNGKYVTHVRGETAPLIAPAINEAVEVSERSGVSLHISHLKVIGLNHGDRNRISTVLDRLTTANERGIDVGFDCYPYTRGSTLLSSLLPRWAHEGGNAGLLSRLQDAGQRNRIRKSIENDDFDGENWLQACGFESINIGSVSNPAHDTCVGLNLLQVANMRGQDPFSALFDLLVESNASIIMVFSMLRPEDMRTVVQHPMAMIGTDAIPCPPGMGRPHPRGYGSFPKILGSLVRNEKIINLETAIHKMTMAPAKSFGLTDRGCIAEGMWADLVIFDRKKIIDLATYDKPRRHPKGIKYVFVDGRLIVKHGNIVSSNRGSFI